MKTSPLALAFRIAQIIEEHSSRDISEAVVLLKAHGVNSTLLELLSENRAGTASEYPKASTAAARSPDETISRVIVQLRDTDPEKFRVLREFDRLLR